MTPEEKKTTAPADTKPEKAKAPTEAKKEAPKAQSAKADQPGKDAPKKDEKQSKIDAILKDTPAPEKTDAAEGATDKAGKKKVKKVKRSVPKARACITAGENNTIITITDPEGRTLAWASAGSSGFKGTRKSTPYAAKVAAERAMGMVLPFGVQSLSIELKGIGPGREQAIRGLQAAGVLFESIVDRTPIAHGGCRPKRPRRV